MSRKSRQRAKRRAAEDFWEGVDFTAIRKSKPNKVVRIFLHDDQTVRIYEDRTSAEQPAKLYYDWRTGSTNKAAQLPQTK
jgi:hypothetical protein